METETIVQQTWLMLPSAPSHAFGSTRSPGANSGSPKTDRGGRITSLHLERS
jgi:hypothetical protein